MDESPDRAEKKRRAVAEQKGRGRESNQKASEAAHVLQRVVPSPSRCDAGLRGMSRAIIADGVGGEAQDEGEPCSATTRACETNDEIGNGAWWSCLRVVHAERVLCAEPTKLSDPEAITSAECGNSAATDNWAYYFRIF